MRIGFIGMGKLGREAAEVMNEKHIVTGYDLVPVETTVSMAQDLEELTCQPNDIIFIAVPTPHDPDYDGRYPTSHLPPKDFDYSIVKEILTELNKYLSKKDLVVLISTVLPGTIRDQFIPLTDNYRFIYNPYLIAMGTVKWDMVNPEMVIIGTEDGTETGDAKMLLDFYKTFIKEGTRYEVGTWDEAEAIKIFYNTFISTKVVLANMIQDVSEKNGNMNVDVVTGALERSTQRIISKAYLKAGMGDGGGCHPRDNIALRYMSKKLDLGYDLFDTIMRSREVQSENVAKRLVELSNEYSLPIVILGKSFKPDVEFQEGSTSILTGYYVNQLGKEVEFDTEPKSAVYLLGHRGKFQDYQFPEGSVVLDVWREYKNNKIKVVYYGYYK
jgi:UDPglucose 6-dehydrogenase